MEKKVFKPTAISVLDKMPEVFKYTEFVTLALNDGVVDMTGKRWISKLQSKGIIEKREDGLYRKVEKESYFD